jgi:hypothetical protein
MINLRKFTRNNLTNGMIRRFATIPSDVIGTKENWGMELDELDQMIS